MIEPISQRARDLYDRAPVWDAHSGFMPDPHADLGQLKIWREAGVSYLSINVGFDLLPWEHTAKTLAVFRHWILSHGEEFTLVATVEEIRRARAEGKMAVTFDIEGMGALDGRIEMIEFYHRLGVRQMLFAYNRNNRAGGGCHDGNMGLTDFGRDAIDEMNRLGMFVDLSHCSHRTSMEAMEYSRRPVIFSHSNPRALCNHERNIGDDQIRACAASGGIIGVVGVNLFLGTNDICAEIIADHVEYLLNVAGPRHVGIGLDYSFPVDAAATDAIIRANPQFWPRESGYASETHLEYAAPARLLELTEVLLRRGHAEEVVQGILGGNFLRLAGEVWA